MANTPSYRVNSPETVYPALQGMGRTITHQQRLINALQERIQALEAEVLRLRHQRRNRRKRERQRVAEAHAQGAHSVKLLVSEAADAGPEFLAHVAGRLF